MILTAQQIEEAFNWGSPQEKNTRNGQKLLRKAPATQKAVAFWKENSAELSAHGVTYGPRYKRPGQFEFCWWQRIPEKHKRALAASVALKADIDVPVKPGLEYRDFQLAGIAYGMQAPEGFIIGDEMGLGKTVQAIGFLNMHPKAFDVLIICPAKLKLNWYSELRKWLIHQRSIAIADAQCFPTSQIVILNYDIAAKHRTNLEKRFWDAVILDEFQYVKNPKAERTKAIVGYRPNREEKAAGIELSTGIPARRRCALSGTPIENHHFEIYPVLRWLCPKEWGKESDFVHRYCGNSKTGSTNGAELQKRLRQTCMIRRMKAEVLTELPPKQRQVIMLPGDEAVSRTSALGQWESRVVELMARVEVTKAGDDPKAFEFAMSELERGISVAFEEMSKVRHETALAKLPAAKEFISDILDQTEKVIVFGHHSDVLEDIAHSFRGAGAVLVNGEVGSTEAQSRKDRFQNDPRCRVFVGGIRSAGAGLTLTASSTVVFVEEDWVPGRMQQAEDRAHRIGQLDSVNVYHLVLEGSLDMRVAQILVEKMDIIDRAMNSDDQNAKIWAERQRGKPVNPFGGRSMFKREEVVEEAKRMSEAVASGVLLMMRELGRMGTDADGGTVRGFNKLDVAVARQLGGLFFLSAKQAVIGRKVLSNYAARFDAARVANIGLNMH